MEYIDIDNVSDEKALGTLNAKNLTFDEKKSFLDNIDENIERMIFDVGLDKKALSSFVGSKLSYSEFYRKYEEEFKSGKIKKDQSVVNSAYDYMIMFLHALLITYGEDYKVITIEGNTDGMAVFSALYEKFKNGPYMHLDSFNSYYTSKNMNQGQNQLLLGKKGKNE